MMLFQSDMILMLGRHQCTSNQSERVPLTDPSIQTGRPKLKESYSILSKLRDITMMASSVSFKAVLIWLLTLRDHDIQIS